MLIGKKCDFLGNITGIIVDKYIDACFAGLVRELYIVDTGEKLEHVPCSYLIKIYTGTSNNNNMNGYENPSLSHSF